MEVGIRTYKRASLRVAIPLSLPEYMQPHMRELISIRSEDQRSGQATRLMHQVCQEADTARMTLILQVKPFADGLTEEQLQRWYSKFGFEVIQTDPILMARQIQPNRIVH